MSGKQSAQNPQLNIYSNSIIQLSVPTGSPLSDDICVQWKCLNSCSYLSQNRPLVTAKNGLRYVCSPLDHGSVLNVTLRNPANSHIIETMNYGPVKIQQQLIHSSHHFQPTYQVQFAFNQVIHKRGSLSIDDRVDGVHLKVQIEKNQQLDVNLKKYQTTLPLLKLYDNEPRSLGIYVSHQLERFKQIFKTQKVWNHYGHYLKVSFHDRLSRDALIYQLMRRSGLVIDQLESVLRKEEKIKNKFDVKVLIKESQSANMQRDDDQDSAQTEVIQDFYGILYAPEKQKSSQNLTKSIIDEKVSFDKDSAKTMKESSFSSSEEQYYRKKFGSIIIEEPDYGKRLINIEKKQQSSTKKLSPQEKFQELRLQYERLMKENVKLKKQNFQLQEQTSDPKANKMSEITQFISVMVKRLQDLQKKQLYSKNPKLLTETAKYPPNKSKLIPKIPYKPQVDQNLSLTRQKITKDPKQINGGLNSTKQRWKQKPIVTSPKKVSPSPIRCIKPFP